MKNWITRCFMWVARNRASLLHTLQVAALVWIAYELHDLNDTIYSAESGIADKVDDVANKIDEVVSEVARLADHQLFK